MRKGKAQRTALFAFIFALALFQRAAFAAPQCAIKPPVEITVTADAGALQASGAGSITVTATPLADAAGAEVSFATEYGEVSISGASSVVLGPLTAGQSYTVESAIQLTGKGDASVRCWVKAYDSFGRPSFSRSRALYIAESHGQFEISGTDDVSPKLALYKRLQSQKTISAQEYAAKVQHLLSGGGIEQKSLGRGGAKQGSIYLTGDIKWTDDAGGTHPVYSAKMEILERDGANFTVITTTTVTEGYYYIAVDNADPEGGQRDVAVRVLADDDRYGRVHPQGVDTTYSMQSSVTPDVPDGSTVTITLTANNTDANQRAFSVLGCMTKVGIAGVNLLTLAKLPVNFPTTASTSNYDGTSMNVLRDDWSDWDVVGHEYGHYVGDKGGFNETCGDEHGFDDNLAERYGNKTKGLCLAFGEGWATYFGTAAQTVFGLSSLNVPRVGDTVYQDTIDSTNKVDLEGKGGAGDHGEDNEMSVGRALYDLYDGGADERDEVTIGFYTTYYHAHTVGAVSLSQYWNSLIAGATMQDKVRYGCVFADHEVAAEPTDPADGYDQAQPPTFKWEPNGAGPANPLNRFTVQFWKDDYSAMIFESAEVQVNEWTPTQPEWDGILAGGKLIKWIVSGRNVTEPETGKYISCPRTIKGADIAFVIDDTGSMTEEIGGVVSALESFIAELLLGEEAPPIINVLTFKDNVSSRIVSDDLLAVDAVVAALTAGGGDDCPESSVEALNLAGTNLRRGGRILFATDANGHKGMDVGATIAALRAKGLRVDVLLTGICPFDKSNPENETLGACNDADCETEEKSPPQCDTGDCTFDALPPVFPNASNVLFSAIAQQTGGVFAFIPEVNAGRPERFNNTALNIMLGGAFPTVVTASPPGAGQGSQVDVLFQGSSTSFNSGSVLSVAGGGVTVDSTRFLSPTELLVRITVAPDAALGARDVSVATDLGGGAGETAEGTGVLTIVGPVLSPTILSIQPSLVSLGQTATVVVSGVQTHFDGSSSLDLGEGITVNSFTANSATQGTANITVDASADTLGFHNVTVSSSGEFASEFLDGPLLVTSNVFAEAIPRILSVSPLSAAPGASVTLNIAGSNTNFDDGASVGTISGDGITVDATHAADATHATIDIAVAASATPGVRDVAITTGAESAVLLDGFLVSVIVPNQPPVANAGPDQEVTLPAGATTVNVTLDGSGSSDADGSIATYAWTAAPAGTPAPAGTAHPTVALGAGEFTFSLVVADDDGALSTADTVVVTVEEEEAPSLSVSPPTLQFPTVAAGSTGTGTVTLTNSGDAAAAGTIGVSGSGFSLAGASTFNVAEGGTATITVNFTPGGKGDFTGTMTFTPGAGAPLMVTLQGTGQGTGCAGCGPGGGAGSWVGDALAAVFTGALLALAHVRRKRVHLAREVH